MTEPLLPQEFAEFEPLLADWSFATQKARAVKRVHTDIRILKGFHDAIYPRIHDIITYFNRLPNDPEMLRPDVKRLYDLVLMFMEAAAPVDLDWPSGDIEDSFPMDRFEIIE
jgi:hypothetical protein